MVQKQGINLHDSITRTDWESVGKYLSIEFPDYIRCQVSLKFGPGGSRIWVPAKEEERRLWRCCLEGPRYMFVFGLMVNLEGSPAHGAILYKDQEPMISVPLGQMWMTKKPIGLFWNVGEIKEGENWEFEIFPGDCQTEVDLIALLVRRE